MGRPVDHLTEDDFDWLQMIEVGGKSRPLLTIQQGAPFLSVRLARDDEIKETELDPDHLPSGTLVFAIVMAQPNSSKSFMVDDRCITSVSAHPSLRKQIEGLNPGALSTLFYRATALAGDSHIRRKTFFSNNLSPSSH